MHTRTISEILQDRKFFTATCDTSARAAAQMMKKNHVSAVVVIDDRERLVGICAERDIVFQVVAERLDPDSVPMTAIMTKHPQTIAADKPFGHALHMMYEGGFHHIPVVDSAGRPVGILCARDALGCEAVEFEHELMQREEITVIL